MTDKIFDDFMRDRLRNHSSPIPEGLWEKIEKEKRRRPVGFFWNSRSILGLLFIGALSIGGFVLLQPSKQQQTTITDKELISNKKTNSENSNQPSTVDPKENKVSSEPIPTTIIASEKNTTTSTNKNVEEQNLVIKDNAAEKNVALKNRKVIASINNKVSSIKYSEKITSNNNDLLIASNRKDNKKKAFSSIVSTDNNNQNSYSTGFNKNKELLVGNMQKESSSKAFGQGLLMPVWSKLNFASTNKLASSLQGMKLSTIVDCPSANGNARNDWYLELYAAPDYTFKSVKGNAASSSYLQKKDSSESMRIGYTVGGRISRSIGEHLILKAGLQFSQINERFTLRTENERRTTIVITTKNITDASGNVATVSDTSSITQIGYLVKTSNNQYRSIEVPLTLGYEFGDEKWKFNLNGGAIINVASWYKGNTLDTSYQAVALTKSSGDIYKQAVGISLYGSISIIKPVAEKFDFFAEPYFRYSLSNISSNSLGYKQRFSTVGLSLGIRYKLNGKRQRL